MDISNFRKIAKRELAVFLVLLFVGLVLMPILIFEVGQIVFGAYDGGGYGDFFGALSTRVRSGDGVAWFLVLSPWLGWQCLRLTGAAWRATRA